MSARTTERVYKHDVDITRLRPHHSNLEVQYVKIYLHSSEHVKRKRLSIY